MKKFVLCLITCITVLGFTYNIVYASDDNVKQDILSIMMGYPGLIKDIQKDEQGKIYLITLSGRRILYDDGADKGFDAKVNNADIEDTLHQIYPLEMPEKLTDINLDPGRFRCYDLLNEVYGDSQSKVQSNLTSVPAPYSNYQFNKCNKAAESLGAAMNELREAAKLNNKIAALIGSVNGTFNYRVIAGTGKLSPHAYGIAIDIASNPSDYWKWASREAGEKRMLYYPKELVEIFEKHNFVWGGKWGHFDILHFEYRPEVIIKARYFSDGEVQSEESWFKQIPLNEENQKLIEFIDSRVQ